MGFKSVKKFAMNHENGIRFRNEALQSLIIRCLRFANLEFRKTLYYYKENYNFHLGNNFVDENKFKIILDELVELRCKSLILEREYQEYRMKQKKLGFRQPSKIEKQYRLNIYKEISCIWDKFK
ncbi:MAG: hypothetical protein U0354_12510 [Candidatus Sericytochromatia bacterium]